MKCVLKKCKYNKAGKCSFSKNPLEDCLGIGYMGNLRCIVMEII